MDKIWPCDDEESLRFPIFTRANTGEVFADAATPLTWSVLGQQVYENGYRDALYEMGAFVPADFRPENEGEVVGCFGGYVYINVSLSRVLAVRVPGMDWRAIDQAFFGEAPDVPPYQPHPGDENAECTEKVGSWLASLFTATRPHHPLRARPRRPLPRAGPGLPQGLRDPHARHLQREHRLGRGDPDRDGRRPR